MQKEQVTKRQTTQHEDQERGMEIGMDEAWKANLKRTYDRTEETLQKTTVDAQSHLNALQQIQIQALANMVENSNAQSKQMIRHAEIAIDRQWNVDEQGYQAKEILGNEVFNDAVAAAVATAINGNKKK